MITIQDVAILAGVSRATVSRVLNNNPSVDPVIRDRVTEAVNELGYQPNRSARRLRAQSGDLIGLVISDIQNPFFGSAIRAIEDTAYKHQMNMLLCNSDENVERQNIYLRILEAESIAGVIIVPADTINSEILMRLHKRGIPVVMLDRDSDQPEFDLVKSDNVTGAVDAINHLIEQGYRRIGIVNLGRHVTSGLERYTGYVQALSDAGIPIDYKLVRMGDTRIESGYSMTRDLLQQSDPPEALFIANNMMTLGALRAIRELGLRVPQDVAIVGFDDMPWSEDLYVPLTTVAQPVHELGVAAFNRLYERIADPHGPRQVIELPTRLVIRESSGRSKI